MKFLNMIFVIIFISGSFAFSQEEQKDETIFPKFIPYANEVNNLQDSSAKVDIREYWQEQPAHWLSVDPMANKYPGWSPYCYSLNNPIRFLDPTGMWSADFDKEKKTVSVKYEKGDTYESLYTQLGMTADDFSKQYGVDLSKDISSDASFDITNKVISNDNFDSNSENSNCFGFVNFAGLGNGKEENSLPQLDVSNLQTTANPLTGDIAIFNMTGQYQYKGQDSPVDASNIQGHGAIFVINNQAGEAQYLNRLNTGQPVTINTKSQIVSFFANPNNAYGGANAYTILPKLSSNPTYLINNRLLYVSLYLVIIHFNYIYYKCTKSYSIG